MDAEIRYARRDDGARTAYAVLGRGPAMVVPPGFLSNLEWTLNSGEPARQFWDALAQHRTLLIYDRHGCGLSDRRRTDFSADDDMRDLYAVMEAAGADVVDFFGISFGGSPAVRFAGEHPERVGRLVLWGTHGGALDPSRLPESVKAQEAARRALRHADPEGYMRLSATRMFPSGVDPQTFRTFIRANFESITVETADGLEQVVFDNRHLLDKVTAPTLVLHRRGDGMVPFAVGQYVARELPNARFVPLEGDEHLPYFGDSATALARIIEFLTKDRQAASQGPTTVDKATLQSGTAVILFIDIADSTGLTERMGDTSFRSAARALDERMRAAIREAHGTPVEGKVLGDGVMAVFSSAARAVEAARRCEGLSAESELRLHVGLHAGDVISEGDNVYGGAVNIAARICGLSEPGEILVSATVRDLARTSSAVRFEDRGEHALKGMAEPVRVYAMA